MSSVRDDSSARQRFRGIDKLDAVELRDNLSTQTCVAALTTVHVLTIQSVGWAAACYGPKLVAVDKTVLSIFLSPPASPPPSFSFSHYTLLPGILPGQPTQSHWNTVL